MLNTWSRCLGSRPRRAASVLRPAVQLAHSWETKPGMNVTMQTRRCPPAGQHVVGHVARGVVQHAGRACALHLQKSGKPPTSSRLAPGFDLIRRAWRPDTTCDLG